MSIAPDSTSYPTLAVIRRFGLEGDDARAVWRLSDAIAVAARAALYGDPVTALTALPDLDDRLRELVERLGRPGTVVAKALADNVARAVDWCERDAAEHALRGRGGRT